MISVRALFFDVFGTLVDWRSGVAREAELVLKPLGLIMDWYAFADAWREQYQPAMEEVRSGRSPYTKLDVLHRRTLQKVVARFGIKTLDEAALAQLTQAWHRLDAWQDVPDGLARLRQRFLIRWDAILGADHARDFKPKPKVYLAAADAFDLPLSECMMCASHSSDLAAAAANGLRTAFIPRPQEQPGVSESAPATPVDVIAQTTLDLAAKLHQTL